jgi:hypothetical protein
VGGKGSQTPTRELRSKDGSNKVKEQERDEASECCISDFAGATAGKSSKTSNTKIIFMRKGE